MSVFVRERFRKNYRSPHLAFGKGSERERESDRTIKRERKEGEGEKERDGGIFIHETRIAVLQASSHVLDTFTHMGYRERPRARDVSKRARAHRDASTDRAVAEEYRKLRVRLFARICYYITVSWRNDKREKKHERRKAV